MDFLFKIPAKLGFLLAVYLSCRTATVAQDLLSKIYSMLFPVQLEELLN